jgi:hypothetical protein
MSNHDTIEFLKAMLVVFVGIVSFGFGYRQGRRAK